MADELKNYIVERMLADVKILEQTGHLQASGSAAMRSHLEPLLSVSQHVTPYSIPTSIPSPVYSATAALAMKSPPPVPTAPQVDSVKALWAHQGAADDELPFEAGDVIHVTERTSADWWRGVVQGKPGAPRLFPSNYVEAIKIPTQARALPPTFKSYTPYFPVAPVSPPVPHDDDAEKRRSSIGVAPWQPGQSRFTSGAPPPPPPPQSIQSAAPVPEDPRVAEAKKNKLKKIGGRIGDGAAHGAGAGLAFAVVNKIF